ncbi:hypothetical protein MES5069_250070 [Mesorhizobium escarrei]|uniref:Uncharacterized protein n=1 Tax=Mesorhizobium escarrei TaxID=666018 RepID=A0ABM9DUC2_9HYPH|nr:hypothetical protein MES5069_250070 [Mesorhizobium escarrei]
MAVFERDRLLVQRYSHDIMALGGETEYARKIKDKARHRCCRVRQHLDDLFAQCGSVRRGGAARLRRHIA